MAVTDVPSYDVDFISDEAAVDPYPQYARLRALGPLVWVERLGMYAVTRDGLAREVLGNPEVYSSAQGVSANPDLNAQSGGAMLITTDGQQHRELREVFRRPLRPKALQAISSQLADEATGLVDRLLGYGTFDGVNDFAAHLPLTIVSRLIGVPEEGRERLLEWGTGFIEMAGGDNDRGRAAAPQAMEMIRWATDNITPEKVTEGGWAHQLIDAHQAGAIGEEWIVRLTIDYIIAGLDTTISATSSLLYQLGRNPQQWDLLRADPGLIQSAMGEAIRLESPLQAMSRVTTRTTELRRSPPCRGIPGARDLRLREPRRGALGPARGVRHHAAGRNRAPRVRTRRARVRRTGPGEARDPVADEGHDPPRHADRGRRAGLASAQWGASPVLAPDAIHLTTRTTHIGLGPDRSELECIGAHDMARILAAKIGDVPDGEAIVIPKAVTGTVDDIALFHDRGEYFALDNTCSHELASLAEGWIEGGVVECPMHTGRFCLRSGEVKSAPATEDVVSHSVEVDGDDIVIVPNPDRCIAS